MSSESGGRRWRLYLEMVLDWLLVRVRLWIERQARVDCRASECSLLSAEMSMLWVGFGVRRVCDAGTLAAKSRRNRCCDEGMLV